MISMLLCIVFCDEGTLQRPRIAFLKTSILPFVLESEERSPGPTIANLTYFIRGVVFCPFDLDMIPDMLDAISLLESLRKYFIENVRKAIKDCPQGHSQGGDTQVEGAGDRMLDPDDVDALRKSLAKDKDQRKTYRGIIDRCICLVSQVQPRTESIQR